MIVCQNHPAGCCSGCGDRRDWQAKNGAQVKFEFAQVLADQGDQAGVVGAGREFGKDHLITTEEKFHTEEAGTAQVVGDGLCHGLGLMQLLVGQLRRLPAALIVPPFLFVADWCTEQGFAIALTDGEQGDLQIKMEKFLHDHLG